MYSIRSNRDYWNTSALVKPLRTTGILFIGSLASLETLNESQHVFTNWLHSLLLYSLIVQTGGIEDFGRNFLSWWRIAMVLLNSHRCRSNGNCLLCLVYNNKKNINIYMWRENIRVSSSSDSDNLEVINFWKGVRKGLFNE